MYITSFGKSGRHYYAVHSHLNAPGINHTCKSILFKYRNILYGLGTIFLLLLLHWNYQSESYADKLFNTYCQNQPSNAFLFGVIENILISVVMLIVYYIFFNAYWKLRYSYNLSILSNIDALIISFPWLLSPVLRFHSITTIIINISVLIHSLMVKYNLVSIEDESISNTFAISNLLRSFCSLILWNIVDYLLWSEYGLLFLYEKGPNTAIHSLMSDYHRLMRNELRKHLNYIDDLVNLILSFDDHEAIGRLIEMKISIHYALTDSNLNDPFKFFAAITSIISGYRLYLTPAVSYLFYPILLTFGFVLMLFLFFITLLNGTFVPDIFYAGKDVYIVFGMWFTGILWTLFVWKCMEKRLQTLKKIQKTHDTNMTKTFKDQSESNHLIIDVQNAHHTN